MRKFNKLGRRAAALVLAVGLTLSTAAPVLAADADEVQTPAAQTEQQDADTDTDADANTEADEADVDTEADEAAALPELSEDRAVAEEDEAAALPELSEDREAAGADEDWPVDEYAARASHTHKYTKKGNTVAPTCTTKGYTVYQCEGYDEIKFSMKKGFYTVHHDCSETTKKDYTDMLPHTKGEEVTEKRVEPTCTEAGSATYICKVCKQEFTETLKALGHTKGEELTEKRVEPTCTEEGSATYICSVCEKEFTVPLEKIPHAWGEYVNDNKPACEQQTGTAHCTREGCTATDTCNLPNFGADGNPLPHKFTHYETIKETHYQELFGQKIPYDVYKNQSTCDYCHKETKTVSITDGDSAKDIATGAATDTALKNVNLDGKTADEYVDAIINKALANAQEAVKNAKTKEEALDALDQISSAVKSELSSVKITVAGVGDDVTISPDDLNRALAPLDSTIADLKSSLNDSFLSQDTITNVVNKLADDVQGSSTPKTGIRKILYNTVYDTIYNLGVPDDKKKTTDNTQAISDMVLQLVKEVVSNGDEETWKNLTESLVDDAVDLAVDELMKDKTYAKLLKTKLGAATMEEVRAEVKNQLVNDPTFMNQVRGIANKAASNAQERVNGGWPTEKIMDGLQKDLLPGVTDLVSNQVSKLGASAGDIVDNKVSDTVHKFLPGKLGDWVSDKIGGKVNDAVTGKVDDLNKQVTDLISTTIKQLTCTHEWGDRETLKNPTCTEKGQTGVVCHKCGKVKDKKDDLEPTGHTPVTDPAVAPTETSDGLTEGSHCGVCGAVLTAQEVIPMLDPTIDTWFSRAATTEADAKAAGYDSVDAANAALDAALTAAGFDPANAEHFTVQVNSSIGVLPNDRFSESGVTGKLTLPEGTRGKTAQTYYAVQMFTADTRFHKAGDVVVTPVSIDNYAKTGLQFTVYSEAVMAIAWKAQ